MATLPLRFAAGAVTAAMAMLIPTSASVAAETLRYDWQAGQKFSYRWEITVDEDDAETSYRGITHYTVDKVDDGQLRVTYRGGLTESKKTKQVNRGRPGIPFPRGGPPRIPSPFSRPTFAGKTQTTNRITLTPRGNALAMEGDSQLPYLLGNLSLIPFEALPAGDEQQWKVDSGVSITEKDEDRDRFGRFGPRFGPFAQEDPKNVQAASEVTSYKVAGNEANLLKVARTYKLTTPETRGNPAFDMTGDGIWTFNTKDHVPHALAASYKLQVKQGNSATTIPISVKYERISAEELARLDAESKAKAAEMAATRAEAKAAAEAPLTAEDKQAALAALKSDDDARIQAQLAALAAKTPLEADADIVAAIKGHLTSDSKSIAGAADKALVAWSDDYKQLKGLQKAWQGPGVLKSTGLAVESTTPLYVGQIVQAQRKNRGTFWFAAEVEKLLPDGQVQLGFLTWGEVRGSEAVERRKIQRAPEELPQSARPAETTSTASPTASTPAARTWSDATGRFKLEAVYEGVENGQVRLRRAEDNRVVSIPLDRLSAEDQAVVKKLQQTPAAENPFKLE